ncbi:MAG TPA: hypothetical protein DEA50_02250 [Parvularcula sp.]|nr:hypothetical protein [Parvularcula sp.]
MKVGSTLAMKPWHARLSMSLFNDLLKRDSRMSTNIGFALTGNIGSGSTHVAVKFLRDQSRPQQRSTLRIKLNSHREDWAVWLIEARCRNASRFYVHCRDAIGKLSDGEMFAMEGVRV